MLFFFKFCLQSQFTVCHVFILQQNAIRNVYSHALNDYLLFKLNRNCLSKFVLKEFFFPFTVEHFCKNSRFVFKILFDCYVNCALMFLNIYILKHVSRTVIPTDKFLFDWANKSLHNTQKKNNFLLQKKKN